LAVPPVEIPCCDFNSPVQRGDVRSSRRFSRCGLWSGDGQEFAVESKVFGDLTFPPRGAAEFGYDPCFLPDGFERAFAEMSAEEKHGIPADGSQALSHRARAFQMLAENVLARDSSPVANSGS
jgi:inosine/xanthosine triphosphate pyrophosphatase family protein